MKYLRKNKTKKIIGGISIEAFNFKGTPEEKKKKISEIRDLIKTNEKEILEFIMDEISKTDVPVSETKTFEPETNTKKKNTESRGQAFFSSVQNYCFTKECKEKKKGDMAANEAYIKENKMTRNFIKYIYHDRELFWDFSQLEKYLSATGKYGKKSKDVIDAFSSEPDMLDDTTINKLDRDEIMIILLYNYLYAKQDSKDYFQNIYLNQKNPKKTFFDENKEYQIVRYKDSMAIGNPGFYFTSNNNKYFADVAFKIEADVPKRCITKITKQVGVMGEQVPFDGPIYTIEDLKAKLPQFEDISSQTTGGKKRRLKRKNKTKKGGKTPKETYYKYSPNTGKRIRVTTKKNKK